MSKTSSQATMPDPLLRLRGVNAWYGRHAVLKDINLSVMPGEAVALMGRNGSGKSSILKTVMGIIDDKSGLRHFRSINLANYPTHRIAALGIGYVPEDRRTFFDMTVDENIRLGENQAPRHSKGIWTRKDALQLFPQLEPLMKQRASTLSGGEQQMLSIARCLMTCPTLMLLDEPTEGLAPLVVKHLASILNDLKNRGVSFLVSEQNISLVGVLCDRAYLLEKGNVKWSGPMNQLIKSTHLQKRFLKF